MAALGGFHYRLLRRDLKDDPAAGGSAIRAFFLNIAEGSAVVLAVALYSLATFFLGSPITDWGQITRMGLSACVVGTLVAAFYLWRMRDEKLTLTAVSQPASQAMTPPVAATAPVPPPATAEATEGSPSIEAILDDLLAGKISRDEAAARLHRLSHFQPAPS